ncbi:MAG TPA: KEOPS complex subunit Pcc1 [Candidatus Sulfotelmatobacter sp.]|nr:KEOPS complex subunit Pcc1 [Candidatus Sulfotelmatobacter sp.]
MEATITLEYDDQKVAEAVAEAVSPDNYRTPTNLSVKTERKQNTVITEIKTEGKILTFLSTIDDLLFSVSIAEKTLKTIH